MSDGEPRPEGDATTAEAPAPGDWTCPGCGQSRPQAEPSLIAVHVSECDYTDDSGQPYDLTVKWSVTRWHVARVSSAELAAAAGGLPIAELTGRILDPDQDDPDAGLPDLLDDLADASGRDPLGDGWEISDVYDARRDQQSTT